MSFFDDKQEILKVELTTSGRYLMSRGKFKPVYYAFFDDDVLYDGQYGEIEETQNSIQTRILDETPSLKPQTTFTSLENNVKLNTLLAREEETLKVEESQISADKNYALAEPLGNSSTGNDYVPSWSLNMISGTIDSTAQFIDNIDNTEDILQSFIKYPQINLTTASYDIRRKKNDQTTDAGYDTIHLYSTASSVYYYSMNSQPIVIDLREYNVDDLLKNFDIQLFVEEEVAIPGTENTKTVLNQLKFKKDPVSIVDGILLDEPKTYEVQEDETFVEYFFELTVDDEIEITSQDVSSAGGLTYRPLAARRGPYGTDC
jgi:hypothetical protein